MARSSDTVGGDSSTSPRVHRRSACSALYHSPSVSSPGQTTATWRGGSSATKKAVSKRTGAKAGVTSEPASVRSSGRRRRPSRARTSVKLTRSASASRRRSGSRLEGGQAPSGPRASSTPVSSKSSRTAATCWAVRHGVWAARPASPEWTLPPGKAWKPPMKRRAGARPTMKTSAEPGPRASSTLAAAVTSLTAGSLLGFVGGLLGRRLGLALQAALDGLQEALHGEGLADVIDDAEVLGVGLVAAALVGGNHDDGRGVGLALEVLQHRVAAHARHHHVQDDQVGPLVVDLLLALLAVAGLDDAVALLLQDDAQAVAQLHVV